MTLYDQAVWRRQGLAMGSQAGGCSKERVSNGLGLACGQLAGSRMYKQSYNSCFSNRVRGCLQLPLPLGLLAGGRGKRSGWGLKRSVCSSK